MKYFFFLRAFFRFLGTQTSYYCVTDWDTGEMGYDPPLHLWKTRVGFKTAWRTAKMIWLDEDEITPNHELTPPW